VTQIIGRDPVEAIFVNFEAYIGPKCLLDNSIPLVRVKTTEYDELTEASYSFSQFPISLSFSNTVSSLENCVLYEFGI